MRDIAASRTNKRFADVSLNSSTHLSDIQPARKGYRLCRSKKEEIRTDISCKTSGVQLCQLQLATETASVSSTSDQVDNIKTTHCEMTD
jgi:hypothetical protein